MIYFHFVDFLVLIAFFDFALTNYTFDGTDHVLNVNIHIFACLPACLSRLLDRENQRLSLREHEISGHSSSIGLCPNQPFQANCAQPSCPVF
jgi:hypothetical protein